jgi:hypothetical protein
MPDPELDAAAPVSTKPVAAQARVKAFGAFATWLPPRVRRFVVSIVLMLVPFAFAVQTGRIGIDFGNHWDEHLQCRLVARTLKTGVLLPGVYNYPMVPYWLTFSALGFRSVVWQRGRWQKPEPPSIGPLRTLKKILDPRAPGHQRLVDLLQYR